MLPLKNCERDFILYHYTVSKEPRNKISHEERNDRIYLGNGFFGFRNIDYLTRFQIEHTLLQQPNVKLIHTNSTSKKNYFGMSEEVSIYSKLYIQAGCNIKVDHE